MGGCSNECYILIITKNVEDIHLQEKIEKSHKKITQVLGS